MSNEENYIIENEITDTTKKQEYWNTGIGLNKVDNLEPSKYLLDLSEKNINGELKYYEVENLLKTYYETQNSNDINVQKEKECDLVSLRIAMEAQAVSRVQRIGQTNPTVVHYIIVENTIESRMYVFI